MAPQKIRGASAFIAAVISVGAMASACNKQGNARDDEGKPAAIPAMPGAPAAAPAPAPTLAAPAPPPPAMPAPEAAPPLRPLDPTQSISGVVTLPAARRADVAPDDTIFLVARRISDNPQARGALVAVKKLSAASFPVPFTLSSNDMMVPTGNFDGVVTLSVRVDKDGDPMTRRKGDVFGTLAKVKVGDQKVKMTLDQLQKEDESLAGPIDNGAAGLLPGHP